MTTSDEKLIDELSKEAEALGIDLPKAEAEEKTETEPETPKDEKTVEEKKPEESEPDTSAEPAKEKADEEEEEEREETPRKPKVVPYEAHKELKTKYNDLKSKLKEATSQKEIDSLEEEIKVIAEEANADPKVIQKIVDLARRGIKPESKATEESEEEEEVDEEEEKETTETKAVIDPVAEAAYFDKEWSEVLPGLKARYPDASESQLKEAKAIIDKDAHTLSNKDKELDYVLYKNSAKLDELLASPKKNGLETRTPGAKRGEETKVKKSFEEMSADDIRALDNEMKEIELSQSSLKVSKR